MKLRMSKKVRKEKINSYIDDFYIYLVNGLIEKLENESLFCYDMENDLIIFSKFMSFLDVLFWKEVI